MNSIRFDALEPFFSGGCGLVGETPRPHEANAHIEKCAEESPQKAVAAVVTLLRGLGYTSAAKVVESLPVPLTR